LLKKNVVTILIVIGTVIRRATLCFDIVATECNKGLAQVAREFTPPIVFNVGIEQAIDSLDL